MRQHINLWGLIEADHRNVVRLVGLKRRYGTIVHDTVAVDRSTAAYFAPIQ